MATGRLSVCAGGFWLVMFSIGSDAPPLHRSGTGCCSVQALSAGILQPLGLIAAQHGHVVGDMSVLWNVNEFAYSVVQEQVHV
jgi:hypothetical protein